jgi:drug/metabolite transporter (DMT)-like permease
MSLLIHFEAGALPATEITFARSLLGIVVTMLFIWRSILHLGHLKMASLWVRALAGAVSILCFTWKLQHTSVAMANIIFNLSLLLIFGIGYITGKAFDCPQFCHPLATAHSILIRRDKPLQMTLLPGAPSLALAR